MYSINDIPLDNPLYGWSMLRASQVLSSVTKGLSSVTIPGRPGVLPGIPSYRGAPVATIVVRTPDTGLEALYRLFGQNGGIGYMNVTADATRRTLFELTSISSDGITAGDELINSTISLRFPTSDWRDTDLTTITPSGVIDAIANFSVLDGISAEIADADIFIGGDFGNFELDDAGSGSWLKTILSWPYVSGTGLLFKGATGQAFRAETTAPWVPTDDMTEYIDVSGGGGFKITPDSSGGDPSVGIASLKLITANQTLLTFGWRAQNAYVLRNGDI